MEKRIFANRFGLIALMSLSLFASTSAFAGNAPAPTQVVVTNTPAQPVPMVGLVTDADNPARQPFQWYGSFGQTAANTSLFKVITAPANQRLVIEDVSGRCFGGINDVSLGTTIANGNAYQYHFLPSAYWNGTGPASTPVRFYVDPGHDFYFSLSTLGSPAGYCQLSVSGYFISAQTLG